MNQKLLIIATIVAVFLLILCSLDIVVGYQSVNNSVSTLDERVLYNCSPAFEGKLGKIEEALERCVAFFNNSDQDGKILAKKIIFLKTSLTTTSFEHAGIQFIFQLIIGLIVLAIIMTGGALSVILSVFLSLLVVTLLSLAIIILIILRNIPGEKSVL